MRFFLALLALIPIAANAQAWTTSARTVTWAVPPVIGDGVNRSAEISTTAQGGDPPALSSEPAAIDENGKYVRANWLFAGATRLDQGEAKFRTNCGFAKFGQFDPIVGHGQAVFGHHHTFIGDLHVDQNSTYTSLRNNPASSCSGGPLNATAYWEPSLMYEIQTGVFVPLKPRIVTFYYTTGYSNSPHLYRLLRGLGFIGGVDPADPLNAARLAEIPNGVGWEKTNNRYDGWLGWQCVGGTVSPTSHADINPLSGFPRQLVNPDGSDPWGGTCEGADKYLIPNIEAPSCWDGYNLTSPNGRGHFRYPINKADSSYTNVCPQGWWTVPALSAKPEFPNGMNGVSGHAFRSKLFFSSDRMDPNPANWRPRGSTFHFDWMNGWDSVVMKTWLVNCTGAQINGTPGNPLTCGDSTISDTQKMATTGTASPDATLSNNPVVTNHTEYGTGVTKDAVGPVVSGTVVTMTMHHTH